MTVRKLKDLIDAVQAAEAKPLDKIARLKALGAAGLLAEEQFKREGGKARATASTSTCPTTIEIRIGSIPK